MTTYTYVTGANRVETEMSPRGYVTTYVWDGEQRIAVVNVTTNYDAQQNLHAVINPRKNGDWLPARQIATAACERRGCLSPFFRAHLFDGRRRRPGPKKSSPSARQSAIIEKAGWPRLAL